MSLKVDDVMTVEVITIDEKATDKEAADSARGQKRDKLLDRR